MFDLHEPVPYTPPVLKSKRRGLFGWLLVACYVVIGFAALLVTSSVIYTHQNSQQIVAQHLEEEIEREFTGCTEVRPLEHNKWEQQYPLISFCTRVWPDDVSLAILRVDPYGNKRLQKLFARNPRDSKEYDIWAIRLLLEDLHFPLRRSTS